jgi:hypothetical protein
LDSISNFKPRIFIFAGDGPDGLFALEGVHEGTQNWRTRKVVCLWEHQDEEKDGGILSLHFVVVDEKVICVYFSFVSSWIFCLADQAHDVIHPSYSSFGPKFQ